MRIRILDPHWNKNNPDPGYFLINKMNFFNKAELSILFSHFFLSYLRDEPIGNQEIFIIFYTSDLRNTS